MDAKILIFAIGKFIFSLFTKQTHEWSKTHSHSFQLCRFPNLCNPHFPYYLLCLSSIIVEMKKLSFILFCLAFGLFRQSYAAEPIKLQIIFNYFSISSVPSGSK